MFKQMNPIAKKAVLGLITLIGWVGVYASLSQLISDPGSARTWIMLIVFAALVNASMAFVSLLKDPLVFAANALLIPVALALVSGNDRITLALMILALGTLSTYTFAKYLTESISLRVFSVTFRHIGFSALALIGAVTVILLSVLGTASTDKASTAAIDAAWPYVQQVSPQFSSDLTVDEYVIQEMQKQGIQRPSRQMIEQGRKQLSDQFKIEINGEQRISDIGKNYVAEQTSEIINGERVRDALPILLFLTLLILIPFIKLAYAAATFVLYEILKQTKFITIEETQIKAKNILI
jgi:hypothetical protein